MKIYQLILFIILFLLQCNTLNKFSEIKVGMTYDEVEDILGKPKEITRGANELETDYDNIPDDLHKRLNLEVDTTDLKRWYAPKKINTIGNLIYVAWIYDEEKEDTCYFVLDVYKSITDTSTNKIPIYYINNKKVSKSEYLKTGDKEYKSERNTKIEKSMYEVYKKAGRNLPEPTKIEKRIEYLTEKSINNYEVKSDSTEKIFYFIKYKYCILFDASSGRVTETGFFPFYVVKNN